MKQSIIKRKSISLEEQTMTKERTICIATAYIRIGGSYSLQQETFPQEEVAQEESPGETLFSSLEDILRKAITITMTYMSTILEKASGN